jgi:outer membrane protein
MTRLAWLVAAVTVFGAGEARAESQDIDGSTPMRPGVELGARPSFALPLGRFAEGDAALSERMVGSLPLWIDAGYRLHPRVYLGVYGQLAPLLRRDCASCAGLALRAGLDVQVHLSPRERLDPWIGVGAGYEVLTLNEPALATTSRGFELAMVQVGLDYITSRSAVEATGRVGPFVAASLGQFHHQRAEAGGVVTEGGVARGALHGWIGLGLRAAVDL